MKGFKGTYLFALFVVGFVAYAYFFEYKKGETLEAEKAEQSKLFSVSKDDITSVRIDSKKEKIWIEKTGTDGNPQWAMKEPLSDLADLDNVGSLLETLASEKYESIVAEGDKVDFGVYGFNEPIGTIRFQTKSGEKTIAIGSEQALGGKRYARRGDEKKVFLVGYGLESQINKGSKDLRDHRVYRGQQKDVTHIRISQKGNQARGVTELEKRNGKWFLTRPVEQEALVSTVDGYLINLATLKAADIVSGQKTDKQDLKKFNLGSSQQSVTIENSTGEKWSMDLSNAQNSKVYLTTSDRNAIYQIPEASVRGLIRDSDEFRDRAAPFKLAVESVGQIVVKSDDSSFQLLKKATSWVLEPDDKSKLVDQSQVKAFLDRFKNLQAKHFMGLSSGVKIDPTRGEILFKDEAGKLLLSMRWGDNASDQSLYLVRTNLSEELLNVDKTSIQGLAFTGIVRAMAPTPTPLPAKDAAKPTAPAAQGAPPK